MSVNHYLLPITSNELTSILEKPERIRRFVEEREADVRQLGTNGVAIVALTAQSDKDPLAFIRKGASHAVSGWVGKYAEENGNVITCEVDMGYGPASYHRNSFLVEVAQSLAPVTVDVFSKHCELDWLEEKNIYPMGWCDEGRKEELIESFNLYRSCIISAAESGQHLLVWCG